MNKRNILILVSLFLFLGCASKRYVKKGAEFEKVGYYENAADMYYLSLTRKPTNVDAIIGLKRSGQLSLDKKLGQFLNDYNADLVKDAVYKYVDADNYYMKVKNIGVELNFPNHYKDYFQEVKGVYLEQVYNEAYLLLEDEDFKNAEVKFNEIIALDPNYGDVDALKKTAKFEPVYRLGKNYLTQQKYRSAYNSFHEILSSLPKYKDSKELMDYSLENAVITIAINNFKNLSRYWDIEKQFESRIEKHIIDLNSPFLKIVDRENQKQITDEQLLLLEGKVDNSTSSKAGKLLGVKAFLTGELLDYSVSKGTLTKIEKKGYRKEIKIEEKNGVKTEKISYHKTTYFEFGQENNVECRFQFKLISAETAETLVSDFYSPKVSDEIHYAQYDGDGKNLVKGYWNSATKESSNDVINDNATDNKSLQNLLKGNREIKKVEELQNELQNNIAQKVAEKIRNYDPEK